MPSGQPVSARLWPLSLQDRPPSFQKPPVSQSDTSPLVPTVRHERRLVRNLNPVAEDVDTGAPTSHSSQPPASLRTADAGRLQSCVGTNPPGFLPSVENPAGGRDGYAAAEGGPVSTPRPRSGARGMGGSQPGPPARPDSAGEGRVSSPAWGASGLVVGGSRTGRQEARVRVSALPPPGLLEPFDSAPSQFLQIDQQKTHRA